MALLILFLILLEEQLPYRGTHEPSFTIIFIHSFIHLFTPFHLERFFSLAIPESHKARLLPATRRTRQSRWLHTPFKMLISSFNYLIVSFLIDLDQKFNRRPRLTCKQFSVFPPTLIPCPTRLVRPTTFHPSRHLEL